MFEISNERFEELASEALASLPEELSSQMDNVVILVENQCRVATSSVSTKGSRSPSVVRSVTAG